MMATTHAFVGLAIASLVALVAPELGVPAAIGGIAGGLFPDLDMVAVHRRTLHFPVCYWAVAVPTGVAAVLAPGPLTVGVAMFFMAAAVHSASDVLGGGLELRPWEGTSEKAVYVHLTRQWLRPRQWIRYDGSPEDLAVGTLFAVPGILTFDGDIRNAAVAGVVVSAVYTLLRKRIVDWTPERFR